MHGPIGEKFKIPKKLKSPGTNAMKGDLFEHSKWQNSAIFQGTKLKFIHLFTDKCSFTYIPVVEK